MAEPDGSQRIPEVSRLVASRMERLQATDARIVGGWPVPNPELSELLQQRQELIEAISGEAGSLETLRDLSRSTMLLEQHFRHLRRLLALEASQLDSHMAYLEPPLPIDPEPSVFEFLG